MRNVYIYDGTFEGLLCALAHSLACEEKPAQIIPQAEETVDLFSPMVRIPTTDRLVNVCQEFVRDKISPRSLGKIFYAFLAHDEKREQKILDFFMFGQKVGARIDNLLAEPPVLAIDELVYKVRRETHRLQGLIRFQELANGFHLARISPDHNILALLARPFAGRMDGRSWIIADVKRQLALVYDKGDWQLLPWPGEGLPQLAAEEKQWAELWREYFRTIAIKERTNPRLQRQCLPRRYWKYLVEKEGDLQ